ncbi:hypothetical protein HY634_04380 [Candidatus Uhrbacteria bacterium]|nr:hypothetical protein [Candidatus Uhrbacteria bacterium]
MSFRFPIEQIVDESHQLTITFPLSNRQYVFDLAVVNQAVVRQIVRDNITIDDANAAATSMWLDSLAQGVIAYQRALLFKRWANVLTGTLSSVIPTRILDEDSTDFIEDISRRVMVGERWLHRVAPAIFWTLINGIQYTLAGRR